MCSWFLKRKACLHKFEIDVMGLLEFVDLGHSIEPWWLRDAWSLDPAGKHV